MILTYSSDPVHAEVPPGRGYEKEYDFLIYSAHVHAHKYVKDLVSEEASIFSKLQSFVLATTLYTSDPVPRILGKF